MNPFEYQTPPPARALTWEGLVEDAEAGDTVIIQRGGKPAAVMIGYDEYRSLRWLVGA